MSFWRPTAADIAAAVMRDREKPRRAVHGARGCGTVHLDTGEELVPAQPLEPGTPSQAHRTEPAVREVKTVAELWCTPCEQNHCFAPSEVERVVYALTAEASRRGAMEAGSGDDEGVCLEALFDHSLEADAHRLVVDEAVEHRRAFERAHGTPHWRSREGS